MSWFSAAEVESFLYVFLSFFSREFADFDNINIHGIGASSFGGVGEGLVGLVSGFRVPLGDLISAFPLGLERGGFFVPVIYGGGDCAHGHDATHEGGRDAGRKVSNKDVLVGDACEGRVVLEVRDILNKGRGVGVVFSLGHALSREPGDGVAGGVMVFEHSFKLHDEAREGSDGEDPARDSMLSEGGCPSEGRSLGHVGQGKGDFLVVIIVYFLVDEQVELYGIQPLSGFLVGSIKGFQSSNMESGGFLSGHG